MYDYEARRSGVFQINLDHLVFFYMHRNLNTRVFFAFRPHRNAVAVAGNQARVLSSAIPHRLSCRGGLAY